MSQTADVSEPPLTGTPSHRHGVAFWLIWLDFFCVLVGLAGLALSYSYWSLWFHSIDRVVFGACVGIGMSTCLLRLCRTKHSSPAPVRSESFSGQVYLCMALLILVACLGVSSPPLGLLAAGFAMVGWYRIRFHQPSVWFACMVGLACVFPLLIDLLDTFGAFRFLETVSIALTTALSDFIGVVNVPDFSEGDRILYGLGVAHRFRSAGAIDGVLSLVGVTILICVFLERSRLVTALMQLSSLALWIAICSCAWVGLAWISMRTGTWHEWSVSLSIANFVAGLLLLVCLDQFYAAFFESVPPELVSVDFPQVTNAWNWLCNPSNLISNQENAPLPSTRPQWLRQPMIPILSMLDFGQGWNDSRNWLRVLSFAPVLGMLLAIFAVFCFHPFTSQAERFLSEGEQRVSTRQLERMESQLREEEFMRAIEPDTSLHPQTNVSNMQALALYELELLCKRVLLRDRNHARVHYRLGLIYSLTNRGPQAEMEMLDLARWSYGKFPQANAWIARERIIDRARGKSISTRDLLVDLQLASVQAPFDPRLNKVYRELQDNSPNSPAEDLADGPDVVEVAERAVVPSAPTEPPL